MFNFMLELIPLTSTPSLSSQRIFKARSWSFWWECC